MRFRRLLSPAMLSLVIFSSILTSCAHRIVSSAPTSPAPTFCAVAKPILWSARDTDATIIAVKAHNAAWVSLCDTH